MGDYSHEVIESIEFFRKLTKESLITGELDSEEARKFKFTFRTDVELIKNAVKFDLGQMVTALNGINGNMERQFHELPANPCFISFSSIDDDDEHDRSACFLARKENDVVIIDTFWYSPEYKKWSSSESDLRISGIDGSVYSFNHRERTKEFFEGGDLRGSKMNPAMRVYLYMEIFSCSNVEQVVHKPPKFLNKKRLKKNKVPYQEYRTIVIDNDKENGAGSSSANGASSHRRLHLCRGHIRRYKSGKRVWVNAHMRGRQDQGSIEHDYVVKA